METKIQKIIGMIEKLGKNEQELTRVDGIGKKLAKSIIDVLHKNY